MHPNSPLIFNLEAVVAIAVASVFLCRKYLATGAVTDAGGCFVKAKH